MNTYKLFEGYDHKNNYPLYQCIGVNNEYVGEWHTEKRVAESEIRRLTEEYKQDIKLNNGQTAVFVGIDYWSRPVYKIEYNGKKFKACCIELNGNNLHSMSRDGEPCSSLKTELQPAPRKYSAPELPGTTWSTK